MANYEQKNGQFTVWVNDKYTKGGKHPYAKGKGKDLQGNEIEVTLCSFSISAALLRSCKNDFGVYSTMILILKW